MIQTYDYPIFSMGALIVSHNKVAKFDLQLCKVGVVVDSGPHYFYVVFVLLCKRVVSSSRRLAKWCARSFAAGFFPLVEWKVSNLG